MNTKVAFYLFVFLTIVSFPFNSLFSGCEIPGWKTNVTSTNFIALAVSAILAFVAYKYWKISKESNKINPAIVLLQFISSIPLIICANFLSLIYAIKPYSTTEEMLRTIDFVSKTVFISLMVFIIGLIMFGIHLRKRKAPANSQ